MNPSNISLLFNAGKNDNLMSLTYEQVKVIKEIDIPPTHSFEHHTADPTSNSLWNTHLNSNHMNIYNMKRMIQTKKLKIYPEPSEEEFKQVRNCRICKIVNAVAAPHKKPLPKATRTLELVHSDTMGPIMIKGIKNYLTTVIDDYSGFFEISFNPTKAISHQVLNLLGEISSPITVTTGLSYHP